MNRCFLAGSRQQARKGGNDKDISHEPGPGCAPPLEGGRFRRMLDMALMLLLRDKRGNERCPPSVTGFATSAYVVF